MVRYLWFQRFWKFCKACRWNKDLVFWLFLDSLRQFFIQGMGACARLGYTMPIQVILFKKILFNSVENILKEHYELLYDLNSSDYIDCVCMLPFCVQHYHWHKSCGFSKNSEGYRPLSTCFIPGGRYSSPDLQQYWEVYLSLRHSTSGSTNFFGTHTYQKKWLTLYVMLCIEQFCIIVYLLFFLDTYSRDIYLQALLI